MQVTNLYSATKDNLQKHDIKTQNGYKSNLQKENTTGIDTIDLKNHTLNRSKRLFKTKF